MAGSITVSSITLDSDNNFSIKSNTGATLFFANTSGVDIANSIGATAITNDKILSVANTKISGNIISSQITSNPTLYGNVSVTGVIGVGGVTPSTSGSGITFPATQSASSDANTLDDYEEGTWTPSDVSGTGLSFSVAQGYYTKIGNVVTAFFRVDYPSTASGTQAKIGGLPFSVRAGYDGANSGTFLRYTTYSSTNLFLPPGNSSNEMPAFSAGGGAVSNASLSLKRIDAVVVYQTA